MDQGVIRIVRIVVANTNTVQDLIDLLETYPKDEECYLYGDYGQEGNLAIGLKDAIQGNEDIKALTKFRVDQELLKKRLSD